MSESLALLHEGEELLKQSRWEEAAAVLRQSISVDEDNAWSHHHLGDALGRLALLPDAIAAYERALHLSPDSPWTLKNLADAQVRLERWEDAESTYCTAIRLDSTDWLSFLHLGEVRMKLGRSLEAVEAFLRAISLNAMSPWPHHHLGDALGRLGLLPYAVTAYEQALVLSPESPWTLKNLGNALLKLSRWEGAADVYQRSLALVGNDAEISMNLGAALSKLERWHEAESAYLQALSIASDDLRIVEAVAGVWLKLEQWQEAASAYEQCLAAAPQDMQLQRNYGIAVFKLETRKAYLKAHPNEASATPFVDDTLPLPPVEWTEARFGSRVFEVERWLECLVPNLSKAPSVPDAYHGNTTKKPRLLFILDNDFGELTTVMYLLLGQENSDHFMVLLPDRLYQANREAFPQRTFCYHSIEELQQTVDAFSPDIVFLCSGYLYSMHDICSNEALGAFVDWLVERDCKVVTADPFLGVLSQQPVSSLISIDVPDADDLDLPAHVFQHLERVKKEQDEQIIEQLAAAERVLRDHLHLYPAHVSPGSAGANAINQREIAFFNPNLLYKASLEPEEGTKPHWIFILSSTDLDAQLMFEAVRGFSKIVARLLKQAIAFGRRPIFVGPDKFICDLQREMRGQEGAELLSFCSFTRLTSLLLTAEYAFYWNSVSHTILLRSFNGLPVILFDRGHLVRNVEAIYERVVQWYYQGFKPIYMDHYQPLTLENLDAATVDFRRTAGQMGRDFQRAPDPESLVQRILDASGTAQ